VIDIEELVIPASIDAADAADFAEASILANDVEAETYGNDDLRLSPAEVLPWWQDPQSPRRLFGVRIDGRLVGRAMYDRLVSDPDTAWLMVSVLSPYRNRGIGTAMADAIEQHCRAEGRSKLLVYTASADGPGDRIPSPTGFGGVPAGNPEVRFLVKRGYRLQQVERGSRLPLPATLEVPEPATGYRLHYWAGRTPQEWVDDMALLLTRMSTDAPSAGLEEPEDVWTPERIATVEPAHELSPRSMLTAAVEHVPSGRLAGFTTLSVPAETDRAVHQDDTLVLHEHRGNRLGMLLKLANLHHLQREHPGHPSVVTFNAEENRYMLDVNEAVGFVPMGYEGAWRLDL
jgi:GNAT superfamily N-acetyltransferase